MNITQTIETVFRKVLPSPFTIAILLTLLTISLAFFFTDSTGSENHLFTILGYWENGIWNNSLLVFAYQMMLILVLGHVLVLSKPVSKLILLLTRMVTSTASAAILVSISTMMVAFFNWGLGLIFGAILARKVGEYAQQNGIKLNYPLVGAAGYVGLMVWHGGMSGSAPLKVAESGHLEKMLGSDMSSRLPDLISTSETVFSWWNLSIFAVLLICVPLFLRFISSKVKPTELNLPEYQFETSEGKISGAEKLDHSKILAYVFGLIVLIFYGYKYGKDALDLNLGLNSLNFFMIGLAIVLHGSFSRFIKAVEEAIKGTSGILIQFPLYFGIMGVMKSTGMVADISDFFASVATETTLPIFTFFSAGLVNIFVPSGGGQWAVQGPIIVESALKLGVPLPKAIMALAYGDQITNMLQPFWALPLLGITKLKAREILPYTLLLMVLGSVVYILGLLLL
ncbi:short-chain fatty acid transporter [Pseudofulvibacter geojedonensis]|uniref:Short-chain fatty acid transporter n=1 Tax=Pseudofulvibacter geojedonensis TaxID=1123758 RepID=A0ABW3I1L1_9FLAO